MAKYFFELASSGEVSEWICDSDVDAVSQAVSRLERQGYDAGEIVEADDWTADGLNDDGEQCYRLLLWACEEDAANDNGAKSIAQVSRVGK